MIKDRFITTDAVIEYFGRPTTLWFAQRAAGCKTFKRLSELTGINSRRLSAIASGYMTPSETEAGKIGAAIDAGLRKAIQELDEWAETYRPAKAIVKRDAKKK